MAEQIAQDVVKEASRMGDSLPTDETATPINTTSAFGGADTSNVSTSQASFARASSPLTSESITGNNANAKENSNAALLNDAAHSANKSLDQEHGLINGAPTDLTNNDEVKSQNAVMDGGGGSDTDNSKDLAKEQTSGHARTNSVKKQTFFKSSAVTKTFLAKTATSTPPTPGSKAATPSSLAGTAAAQTTKPRLVAKSGSGLGNIPRSGLAQGNGNTGPDASKVWNKNRPIPPPPPKQFTDEELKQQYGIHMATRLQADESGKDQNKWADIDDDEDDWAPEAVEWMDGTKSTVAATAEPADPKEDAQAAATAKSTKATEPATTQLTEPAPKQLQTSGMNSGTKTILKPGGLAQGTQNKQAGLVLRGAPEKPASSTKSPAPAPAKSPWATLPPIDKVSPVHINPLPAQPHPSQSRFSQRDPHGFEALQSVSSPAKEIAADDFSRSWREERGTRELFNSQSGRYEPVGDARRGSFRENSYRQPAVLQRPHHGSGTGPAEPSPAFQTSRSGTDAAPWGRRRTSSNVSAGSGGRRMSFGRGPEPNAMMGDAHFRRDSHSIAVSEAPIPEGQPSESSHLADSDQQNQQHNRLQHASPVSTNAQPTSPFGSAASASAVDTTTQQQAPNDPNAIDAMRKQILARARLAKQAEAEEEARKEAAKKERLAKLMASLPESKPKESVEVPKVDAQKSPPKPPAPTTDGEVKQYGMMKVHSAQPARKSPPADSVEPQLINGVHQQSHDQRQAISRAQHGAQPVIPLQAPLIQPSTDLTKGELPGLRANATQEPPPHTAWKGTVTPENFQPWAGAVGSKTAAPPANVWGPPGSKDRALGNGTFDNNFNRAPTRPSGQGPSPTPGPGPIAPPSRVSPASMQVHANASHAPNKESSRMLASQHDLRQASGTTSGPLPPAAVKAQVNLPDPIAPPSRTALSTMVPARSSVGDWKTLSENPRKHDADMTARQEEAYKAKRATEPRVKPQIEETYRRTVPGSQLGERQVVAIERVVHDQPSGPNARHEFQNAPSAHVHGHAHPHQLQHGVIAPPNHVYGMPQPAQLVGHAPGHRSRFFPTQQARPANAHNQTSDVNHAVAPPGQPIDNNSPPPPEASFTNHPAFDGDASQPKVHLPTPKAVVKLPPASPSPQAAVVMPARPQNMSRLGSQPIVAQTAWQARFNGLLGRAHPGAPNAKTSPNPPAAVIAASSKATFDVIVAPSSATVSLPSQTHEPVRKSPFSIDRSAKIVSKTMAEEELLADQEFGSLPRVNISRGAHKGRFTPFPRQQTRWPKRIESTTGEIFDLDCLELQRHTLTVRIKVPGSQRGAITKSMPRRNHRGGSGYQGKAKRNNGPKADNRPGPAKKDSNSGSSTPNARPQKPNAGSVAPSETRSPRSTSTRGPWHNNTTNNGSGSGRGHTHGQPNAWGKRPAPAAVH